MENKVAKREVKKKIIQNKECKLLFNKICKALWLMATKVRKRLA